MIVTRAGQGTARIQLRSGLVDVWNSPVRVLPAGSDMSLGEPSVLPAVSSAMRLISNDISALPLIVYRETDTNGNAEKARDSWQWELLHQSPIPGLPACQFWFDVTMGIIARGNAHALKLFDGKRLTALQFMGGTVQSRLDHGQVVYDWSQPRDQTVIRGIPAERVVHWRGPNFDGSRDGMSMIQLHRATFETGIIQDSHQNALYHNGAQPKIAFGTTARLSEEQVDGWIERYEARHKGPRNAGKPVLLSEGTTVQQISVTPEDAQFLEQRQYNVADIERIFMLPPSTLQESKTRPAVDADLVHRYVRQTLQPVLVLIEQTLESDPDIFGAGSTLYPEFQTGAILKADIATRYTAYLQGRQAGWLSVDDIRAMENMPPLPNGEGATYQTTPVGGAPNLQPADDGAQQQNDGAERSWRRGGERGAAMTRVDIPEIRVFPEITVQPADVTVNVPEQRAAAPPQVQVDVHVPEQAAPVVNVAAPNVQVDVAAAEAPNVTVEPAQLTLQMPGSNDGGFTVDRDPNTGLITKIKPG